MQSVSSEDSSHYSQAARLDAAPEYFRAPNHGGNGEGGLFSTQIDYLFIGKGCWNPVLSASRQRPGIPRRYAVFPSLLMLVLKR